MRYAVYAVALIYALLCGYAACAPLKAAEKQKGTSALMLAGSLILILAIILHAMETPYSWAIVLAGGALICVAAFLNGKRSGTLHIWHHVVRFILTALLVLGFLFW